MPPRTIEAEGATWTVTTTGRTTQYGKDEFSVLFIRRGNEPEERRIARYSPQGSKERESSLAELSDDALRELLRHSQPSWTSAELGYRR
jgi:hypothetical protein